VIALMYAFIPDVSSAYWILSVMTTQVYLVVYLLMFVAAVRLRRDQPDHPRGYRAPMLGVLCVVGFLASLAAFAIGFIPPSQFGSGNAGVYALLITGGIVIIGFLPPLLLYRLRKDRWQTEPEADPTTGTATETGTGAPEVTS
jgi:amino acid transporter